MEIITRAEAQARGLKRFFSGVPCKSGHVAQRLVSNNGCVACLRERRPASVAKHREKINAAARQWRLDNQEKVSEQGRARYALKKSLEPKKDPKPPISERRRTKYIENIDAIRAKRKAEYWADRDANLERQRKRRVKNRDAINAKRREAYAANPEPIKSAMVKARRINPIIAIAHRTRALVRGSLRRTGYRKSRKTEAILGCSIQDFKKHLEMQFLKGMGWHNMDEWHIDHIVAISSAKNEEEALALNHFTNLRPMWGPDNLSKGSKQTHLI